MKYLLTVSLLFFFGHEKPIEYRQLTYDDFKGSPVGDYAAISSTNVDFVDKKMQGINVLGAKASFNPEKSFIKVKTTKVLKHEQLHFDISELYARMIDGYICECKDYKCPLTGSGKQYLIKEWRKMQDVYDKETNHALNDSAQQVWENRIAGLLIQYPKEHN